MEIGPDVRSQGVGTWRRLAGTTSCLCHSVSTSLWSQLSPGHGCPSGRWWTGIVAVGRVSCPHPGLLLCSGTVLWLLQRRIKWWGRNLKCSPSAPLWGACAGLPWGPSPVPLSCSLHHMGHPVVTCSVQARLTIQLYCEVTNRLECP